MNFGFSTFFFTGHSLRQAMDRIVGAGVNVVEITYDLPHVTDMDDDFFALTGDLRKKGVSFSLHGPLFEVNIGSIFPEVRALSMRRYLDAIDVAASAGCKPVVVHPGYTMLAGKETRTSAMTRENFVADMNTLVEHARQRNIPLALENVHMHYFFFHDLSEFAALQRDIPGLGMTLDVGHAYLTEIARGAADPEGAIVRDVEEIGIENLFHVHLHNNTGVRDDHGFIHGSIDLARILRGLRRLEYREKVVIETYETTHQGLAEVIRHLDALTVA